MIDVVWSELIRITKLINHLYNSKDGQPGHSFLGWTYCC